MKFRSEPLYDALIRETEPIPDDDVSFHQLVAILSRRLKQGESYTALLEAYRDQLAHFLDIESDEFDIDECHSEEDDRND